MNRPIKFRAWDKEFGQMWGNQQSLEMLMNQAIYDFYKGQPNNGHDYKNTIIWMQFTGIIDDNKKEIYEGDLVVFEYWRKNIGRELYYPPAVVKWDADQCSFYLTGHYPTPLNSYRKEIEVIGNIYENSYLLNTYDNQTK